MGDDHRLHAIPDLSFGQDAPDMRLDRGLTDGEFGVAQPAGQQPENFELSRR
jgi:hypothetical protein